ncbi:MAG: SDR family NAD(P)-dependent oxidoreductase, partial [Myxococcota bacterium]
MNSANDPKVLVITGGSRGLGRSMALAAARAGRDVVLTYRTDQAAAEAVVADIREQGQRAVALALDVAEADRFPAFADT